MGKRVKLRNNGKAPELLVWDEDGSEVIPLDYSDVWRLIADGVPMLDFPWTKAPLEYPRDPT